MVIFMYCGAAKCRHITEKDAEEQIKDGLSHAWLCEYTDEELKERDPNAGLLLYHKKCKAYEDKYTTEW